ncbi:CDK-activating kinase assembly factor MAT1 [Anabarilius grahami]|uniref:CDK-activating kinase assembly factor MAT1 n=1 Tax=Anabarilius grahami TaxID=495550 RepID=A0A3N0YTW6_ANAGA|nr:CDK-activating kinase assembly factor MAT1 [Anabarilius grahami]
MGVGILPQKPEQRGTTMWISWEIQWCESCVDMLFVRGSGNCVQCNTPLRKSNFRVQLFEDPAIDKEVEIRKKVLKIYNKREFDFSTLKEYNDYLEQVEDIVFNLTNNVDVERTKQIMEQYQRDNRDVIQKNKAKLTREQEELEELLLQEQQDSEQRRLETLQEEQRQLQAKRKNKQALLDKLESSKLPAAVLLAQHKDRAAQLETQIEKQKQNVKPTNIFSTGIMMGQTVSLASVSRVEEALYVYQPLYIDTYGPSVPELDQLGRQGSFETERRSGHSDNDPGHESESQVRLLKIKLVVIYQDWPAIAPSRTLSVASFPCDFSKLQSLPRHLFISLPEDSLKHKQRERLRVFRCMGKIPVKDFM